MKYQRETYSGPLVRMIGAMKLMATNSNPTSASGSIQTGVSPHSTPCAWPSRMPTAVLSTTTCQATKMKYDRRGSALASRLAAVSPNGVRRENNSQ